MIKTSKQLKDKVRNIAKSDSTKAQALIRNFIMERFLERITLSPYKDNFILKGGMLIAAISGFDMRATMDIDTTVQALSLSMENARKIVEDIIAIELPDGVTFQINKVSEIMEGHAYPGIRIVLAATLDRLKQIIKLDISTGDVITPGAVDFSYKLMFEERSISLWTYNLETLLAEKLETIMSRGTANTRMRDFYDIHIIARDKVIDEAVLGKAFLATCIKRKSDNQITDLISILSEIEKSDMMKKDWENYRKANTFVGDADWKTVLSGVMTLAEHI